MEKLFMFWGFFPINVGFFNAEAAMFRKQFIEVVTSTGMATVGDLKPLTVSKDTNRIAEFELLNISDFDEIAFARRVAEKYNLKFVDLSKAKILDETIGLMSKRQVLKFRAIPVQQTPQKITLCVFDPSVSGQVSELQVFLKKNIDLLVTTISGWKNLFGRVRESVSELLETVEEVNAAKVDEEILEVKDIGLEVVQFVNKLLVEAFVMKASDIHIEVYEKLFRVRVRVDGNLLEIASPSSNYQLPVISRLKIMASMDIAERRLPQDGRIKLRVGGEPIDFRVSSLPTLFGEKIVLRLLDQSTLRLDLTKIGFEKKQLETFNEGINRPYGMCLVVGPTGSGKTTTLYSALSNINDSKKNIVTVEDPVEFNLEGINQVNARNDIGLTFAKSLKSFLRQDPDIIMVGEIRDSEVANIAVEAALTGHLVLSTLHTNDAPSTVTRLLNMGIEPFLLVASLNVVVAQRLCRKICEGCKREITVPIDALIRIGFSEKTAREIKVFRGQGCAKCSDTGYQGRVAIYEAFPITSGIKNLIMKKCSTDELKCLAIREGMKTLRMSALLNLAQGLTTIEEVLHASVSDKNN